MPRHGDLPRQSMQTTPLRRNNEFAQSNLKLWRVCTVAAPDSRAAARTDGEKFSQKLWTWTRCGLYFRHTEETSSYALRDHGAFHAARRRFTAPGRVLFVSNS